MYSENSFDSSPSLGSCKQTWGRKLSERRQPRREPSVPKEEWWRAVGDNIQECYKVWNWKRNAYSVAHVTLTSAALILSFCVIPLASWWELSNLSFFASLAIAGIIAFENAFAIGEKARFYRQIIRELWAVDQEVNEAEFDDVDDHKQLNNVETELRQLIERDKRFLPVKGWQLSVKLVKLASLTR